MRKVTILILLTVFTISLYSSQLVTVAEQTNYAKTSGYDDVMWFINAACTQSEKLNMLRLTTSTEGRMVPMVIVSSDGIKSPAEMNAAGKPSVLIMANIHAGEIEGKEAVQMLLRDFVENKDVDVLKNQVVLLIPIFNADGNEKFGNNRRDNGPELAGTRYNGQFLDLNRDYLKLESPEVRGLLKAIHDWDPVLVVDMHTTNGSWHREPVTYTTNVNPNGAPALSDYMWKQLFPAVAKILKKKYGYESCPYGNFVDRTKPEKGWRNHAYQPRYGNIYVGLRNRFTILDENYSHADFKTRVLASYGFIKSILMFTEQNITLMRKMADTADKDTMENFYKKQYAMEFDTEKLLDVTILSYKFNVEKIKPEDKKKYPPWYGDYIARKTDELKSYTIPYFSKAVPTRSISLPEAYVLLPYHNEAAANLQLHGVVIEKIQKPVQLPVEVFKMEEVKTAKGLYQGHVAITLKGKYSPETVTIPAGSYFISMKQPLARIIPVLLEPESTDSLAAWGFFNRELVSQWSRRPQSYPVLRIPKVTAPIERFQE